MREILFRGKRLDNGDWVEGNLITGTHWLDNNEIAAIVPLDNTFYPRCEITCWFEVDPSTICQFVGLCDKNGKKIFEGDILHLWSEYCEKHVGKCVVKYGKFNCGCCDGVFGWYLDGGDIRFFHSEYPPDYEVCGNIHDNPELLEDVGDEV